MADIRLDRAERGRSIPAKDRAQRFNLDGIPQLGSGAVRLHIPNRLKANIRGGIDFFLQLRLRLSIRSRDAVGPAVLVRFDPEDDAAYRIAIAQRGRKRFQDDHADSLAGHKSIRVLRKRLAAAIRRQHPALAQQQMRVRRAHHRNSAGESDLFRMPPQPFARKLNCNQRGRARRIDRKARPFEIQRIRNPRSQNRAVAPHRVIRVFLLFGEQPAVISLLASNEDPNLLSIQCAVGIARILKRAPCLLKEEALLRVHPFCFDGQDIEEGGIEPVNFGQESAPSAVGLPGRSVVGIVIRGGVPALAWNLSNRRLSRCEHLP